jgi:hypothetical protein
MAPTLTTPAGACEHLFVTLQGSAYSQFKRALERHFLLAWTMATELPKVPLADALSLLLLALDQQPWRFEKAAPRWHARLCAEARLTLPEAQLALAALQSLSGTGAVGGGQALVAICGAHDHDERRRSPRRLARRPRLKRRRSRAAAGRPASAWEAAATVPRATAQSSLSPFASAQSRSADAVGAPWDGAPRTFGPPGSTRSAIVPDIADPPEHQEVSVRGIPSAEAFGTPHVSISASREWLVEGYVRALTRFRASSEQEDKSARDTFLPLFETLNWAVAIQDFLRERGEPLDHHPLLSALRFARNRVHHTWAAALEVREYEVSKSVGPITVAGTTFDWLWISAEHLPLGGNRRGEGEYRTLLAEQPARVGLDDLHALLT